MRDTHLDKLIITLKARQSQQRQARTEMRYQIEALGEKVACAETELEIIENELEIIEEYLKLVDAGDTPEPPTEE